MRKYIEIENKRNLPKDLQPYLSFFENPVPLAEPGKKEDGLNKWTLSQLMELDCGECVPIFVKDWNKNE